MSSTPIVNREWVGNLGYLGMSPEADVGEATTPDDWTLLYDENITTSYNFSDQTPIYGQPFATYQTLPGMRDHKGEFTIAAEPNTATYLFDAMLTIGDSSGSGPYTWPFTLTDGITHSYTIDVSTGWFVKRFFGCMVSKIAPSFEKNEMRFKVSVSALGSFIGATISETPTGSGPYTVTFETQYSATPTLGLVAGDLLRFYHSGGTDYTDCAVDAVTNSTQITTTTDVTTFAEGDFVFLRPATPSFNLENVFLWSETTFQFGADLTAAASASQTRLDTGSVWELMNDFEKDTGSERSGSPDPASLVRTTGKASLTINKFFGLVDDVESYQLLTSSACIVTHNSYSGYSLVVKFPQLVSDNPLPQLKSNDVSYSKIKMHVDFNSNESGGFLVSVVNNLESIT